MISYKKINLLDLKLNDLDIENKDELLQIKSPIITYDLRGSSLYLNINKNSEPHNLFINICGYIHRLFKISGIVCNCVLTEKVTLNITETSKFYDENSNLINCKNIKKDGKIICSFTCHNGEFNLKNFLLVK